MIIKMNPIIMLGIYTQRLNLFQNYLSRCQKFDGVKYGINVVWAGSGTMHQESVKLEKIMNYCS